MVDRPSHPGTDFFGQEEENAISYGLLRSAVEMGEAVTEAGAVSAAAAFFRQNLDACAWTEEPTPPPFGTNGASLGAPPLLRFPLRSEGFDSAVGALHSSNDSDGDLPARPRGRGGCDSAAPFELVVSRGPGPTFSEHETRVARYAALLLSQALTRVRDCAALSEAQSALEVSFRGMQEASDAVTAMVEERERRSRLEAQQGADLEDEHKKEMAVAEDALERARRESEHLRGRLDAAVKLLAAVSEAAGDVCRAVSADVAADSDPGDDAAERGFGLSDGVITVVERAARTALRCSSARVVRLCSSPANIDAAGHMAAGAEGARGDEGGLPASATMDGRFAEEDEDEDDRESRCSAGHGDDESDAAEQLHVPIPHHDHGSSIAEPLALSIHGRVASDPRRRRFSEADRATASALAACLGTALLALREKEERRRVLRRVEADRQADEASAAAAEAEAHERGDRAVAGMRALVAAARLSKAQAEAAVSAAGRAERHTEALARLLSALDGARNDHAAVARVVYRRASAAVPGCEGAVLLTPRRDGKGVKGSASPSFSPDPRAWAAAAAVAAAGASRKGRRAKNGRSRPKAFGGQWARRVERAAVQAASTGEVVCVASSSGSSNADVSGGGEWHAGAGVGGDFCPRRVVCFSPVLGVPSREERGGPADGNISGRPLINSSASTRSDRMRTAELQGEGEEAGVPGSSPQQTPCLVAWMLCLGAREEIRGSVEVGESEEHPEAPSVVSALTDDNISSIPVAVPPPPPSPSPPPLLPPRVSSAMGGVVHAVDLALSACTATAAAAAHHTHRNPERSNAPSASRQPGRKWAQDAATMELERSRRDEELRRLRDSTAALTDRVRTLEGRAAGLRASEARSAAALARARADAGAVKSELELATLELERARRRPLAARSSVGNSLPRRGGRDWSGGLSGVFLASWARPGTMGIDSRLCGPAAGGGGGGRDCAGSGVPAVPAGASEASGGGGGGENGKEVGQALSSHAAFVSTAGLPASSPLPPPVGDASSAALQHMASVHARLSSSLKSGRLPRSTTTPGEGSRPL